MYLQAALRRLQCARSNLSLRRNSIMTRIEEEKDTNEVAKAVCSRPLRFLAAAVAGLSADKLTVLDALTFLELKREVPRCFKDEHDGRSQIELAERFALLDMDALGVVVGLEALVVEVVLLVLPSVGHEVIIEVNLDGADIGSTNSSHTEESMSPPTHVDHTLIHIEQAGDPVDYAGPHTQKSAWKMPPVLHLPLHGGVKTVIITRSQVHHAVIQICVLLLEKLLVILLLTICV